jgi:hypothetical protein
MTYVRIVKKLKIQKNIYVNIVEFQIKVYFMKVDMEIVKSAIIQGNRKKLKL